MKISHRKNKPNLQVSLKLNTHSIQGQSSYPISLQQFFLKWIPEFSVTVKMLLGDPSLLACRNSSPTSTSIQIPASPHCGRQCLKKLSLSSIQETHVWVVLAPNFSLAQFLLLWVFAPFLSLSNQQNRINFGRPP